MRHVRLITILFVIAALLLLGFGLVSGGPAWTLAGLLMAWAAAVKIVVAFLWRHLGTERAVRAPEGTYR